MEHLENFIIDMTSVLNTTTESVQSYNQTYEELPLNVLPPFNVCEWNNLSKFEKKIPGGMLSQTTTIHTLFSRSFVELT